MNADQLNELATRRLRAIGLRFDVNATDADVTAAAEEAIALKNVATNLIQKKAELDAYESRLNGFIAAVTGMDITFVCTELNATPAKLLATLQTLIDRQQATLALAKMQYDAAVEASGLVSVDEF